MRNCLSRTVHYKMVEPETEEPSGPRVLLFIILDGRGLGLWSGKWKENKRERAGEELYRQTSVSKNRERDMCVPSQCSSKGNLCGGEF